MMEQIIFDGKNAILGRLGVEVAKELLKGNSVIVINSEDVVMSGSKKVVVDKIRSKQRMGRGSSLKGPKYPRSADRLLKRMIRGMLPWDTPRGRNAFKNLKCYVGSGSLKEDELKRVVDLKHKRPVKFFRLNEVVEGLK